MDECIQAAGGLEGVLTPAASGPSQSCDLKAGFENVVNVLSVITSAAMLMYKVRAFSDLLHFAQTRIRCVLAQ